MIEGEFNRKGELVFDIGLIAADRTHCPVKAILDTGFNEWLLINNKDAENLEWLRQPDTRKARTAGGTVILNRYEGIVLLDEEEWIVLVLGGDEIKDILLGVRWLRYKRLVADFAAGLLTLG